MTIANELITRGWNQGDYSDDEGRVCLMGAVACAIGKAPQPCETDKTGRFNFEIDDDVIGSSEARAVVRVITGEADEGEAYFAIDEIAVFNDDPKRTYDDVLRVAKEADELLDQ